MLGLRPRAAAIGAPCVTIRPIVLDALATYYRQNGLDPVDFACRHRAACAVGSTSFTTAKASYIGPEYEAGHHPRLLFLSLDSGSGATDARHRTLAAVREHELRRDVQALHKNKHWYLTHELAWALLHRLVPAITVANSARYFAHVNSAKCSQNHPQHRQAEGVLFDNCRSFIPGELLILRPDIVVTQGRQAAKVMEAGFPVLEEMGTGDCQMNVVRCGEQRTLWIHTHHPNAYGLFHAQRKQCWSRFADAVERFIKGGASAPGPIALNRPSVEPVVPATVIRLAPTTPVNDQTPRTIEELVMAARIITSAGTFRSFVADMRRRLPGASHPYVGLLSGRRVQQFQNWLLDENPKWQLTDAQLLAVMRVEFPLATGQVHIGDVDTGLKQVAGIRAHYNRDGHNGPSPISRGMPYSVSYGRF